MIVGQRRLLEEKYGALKAVTVLGSAPRQSANLDSNMTVLRLDFERTALPYSLICLLRDDPNEHFLLPGAPASFEQRFLPAFRDGVSDLRIPAAR